MDKILAVIKNRAQHDHLIVEQASELVLALARANPQLLRDYKREIFDIFESDDFFNCSIGALKAWSRLIDMTLDVTKADLLPEYFDAWAQQHQLHVAVPQPELGEQDAHQELPARLLPNVQRVGSAARWRSTSTRSG